MASHTVVLRSPSQEHPSDLKPPPIAFLNGKWHITHSTLPMWKSRRNVQITYTPLPSSHDSTSGQRIAVIDDLVQFYTSSGDKQHTVHGVDTALIEDSTKLPGQLVNIREGDEQEVVSDWAWKWRGKGLLMIASTTWEVLGYGEEGPQSAEGVIPEPGQRNWYDSNVWKEAQGMGNRWMVTYFRKTLFTPAGIDVYSRDPNGLRKETLEGIKTRLADISELKELAGKMFEISMDAGDGKHPVQ